MKTINEKSKLSLIKKTADGIRKRVLEHTITNNGGYLSQACSSAEIFASLYEEIMNLGSIEAPMMPEQFVSVPNKNFPFKTGADFNGKKSEETDRFILSPAQYALVLYAALVEVGRMDNEGMLQFNKDGSTVEMIGAEHSPGMEVMTGSLGQGLSQASGIAMARKLKGETGNVWVFMSDGEFQSGQNWEAIQAASFHELSNLKIIVDVNRQQCDGAISSVMTIEPFDTRLSSFGAHVVSLNGHDIQGIIDAANVDTGNKPLVILANTNPSEGFELLNKRAPKLHYVRFTSAEEKSMYEKVLADINK
ncbi:MAG: 1-deoxy-D-xylulose-5-phosphate synthase N-terminal domain-containing protein [bacterium]